MGLFAYILIFCESLLDASSPLENYNLQPIVVYNLTMMGISYLTSLQEECIWKYVGSDEALVVKESGQQYAAGCGMNKAACEYRPVGKKIYKDVIVTSEIGMFIPTHVGSRSG